MQEIHVAYFFQLHGIWYHEKLHDGQSSHRKNPAGAFFVA